MTEWVQITPHSSLPCLIPSLYSMPLHWYTVGTICTIVALLSARIVSCLVVTNVVYCLLTNACCSMPCKCTEHGTTNLATNIAAVTICTVYYLSYSYYVNYQIMQCS